MLEQNIIPGIRLGRRWIVTRQAYQYWARTCGMQPAAGLTGEPEVIGGESLRFRFQERCEHEVLPLRKRFLGVRRERKAHWS